jgi:hypothetical protein
MAKTRTALAADVGDTDLSFMPETAALMGARSDTKHPI